MRLLGIFRFELGYQLRRPWPWLMFLVLLGICLLMTRDAGTANALYEDYFVNAPFAIYVTTVVGGLLWLLLAPAIAGEAAARDVATSMYPLVYTRPIRRSDYLIGRFAAALAINLALLLAVQLGILLGIYLPGVNPELVGPFRPAAHLTAYAYLSVPNAIVATTLQFAIALRSGRPMSAYLGSVFLVFMGFFVASMLLYSRGAGTLLDPIGIRFIVEDIAHMWTTAERQWRLLEPTGIVLSNRIAWLSVAAAVMIATFATFRFAHRVERAWPPWRRYRGTGHTHAGSLNGVRRHAAQADAATAAVGHSTVAATARRSTSTSRTVSPVTPRFDIPTRARQTARIAGQSFRALALSWAGLALLVGLPLLSIVIVLDQMVSMGTPLLPTTGQVLKELTGPLSDELSRWIIIPILTVFFAGELVWREREAGLAEITDALPLPEWLTMTGKLLGLLLLLAAFNVSIMIAGMLAQTVLGYQAYDVGLYLTVLFGFQLPEYALFAVLVFAAHVLVDQKYVGHLVAVVLYVIIVLAPMFGIEHNLLIYGASPTWTNTDMRGLGPYVVPWLSFKLYWAAWALLILIAARLLWVRGTENRMALRLRLAHRRMTRAAVGALALAVTLIIGLGGFVFYNTNVLNEYVTEAEQSAHSAEYERRYARYATSPQPALSAARLHVEIHPSLHAVDVRGSYRLTNHGFAPLDTIHVATSPAVDTRALSFDRAVTAVLTDTEFGHRIYTLAEPLQPGDSMRLDFEVHHRTRGFHEGGVNDAIVANGTYFTNAWFPAIGYQRSRELLAPAQRREHGLSARPVIPPLYEVGARTNRTPGVMLDVVVGTADGQTAVAPGTLLRSWSEDERNYYRYETEAPIGHEWAFASARYAVREAHWNDVAIRILHHPPHTGHVEPALRSIQASLDYYTEQLGPYRYGSITVVEVPGDGVGMHADASMLTHGEGITLMNPESGRGSGLDMPYYVVAHEMAHQWNVPAAYVEGAPVLSEGLATYLAIRLVEHTRGQDEVHRLLRFLRLPYPIAPIRRGDPLLRGLDRYMSYRWAPFALNAIAEYAGRDQVSTALRLLFEQHEPADAPLATTLDLYRELQAATPDSLHYLLHDLFEVNTFWRFSVERVRADSMADGRWQVTMDVHARKLVYDSIGTETEVAMDEWVPVGVFATAEPGSGELSAPLHLEMQRIRSGAQTITVTVAGRPVLAGVDPFHVLDWEELEDDDNVEGVEIVTDLP